MDKAILSEVAQAVELVKRVRAFVDEQTLPYETLLDAENDAARKLTKELLQQEKTAGVLGNFYPLEHGGRVACLADYEIVTQQEGRSEYATWKSWRRCHTGCLLVLASRQPCCQRAFFLPLVRGEAVSSDAMSKQESIGSIPATMACRARLKKRRWHIKRRKWYICQSQIAGFATVMVRTAQEPVGKSLSMIFVPTAATGSQVVRPLSRLGRWQGQSELAFNNAQVPHDYVLEEPGKSIILMKERLGLGRLLWSARWLGQSQRCFDLMCQCIYSSKQELAKLADKQLARLRICRTYRNIAFAHALGFDAAWKFDANVDNSIEVNLAILVASDALNSTLGRQLLMAKTPGTTFDPACPSYTLSRTAL